MSSQDRNLVKRYVFKWRLKVATVAESVTCPPPAKNFAWDDGNWAIYGTHHANLHVVLLNLLSPFKESKWSKICWQPGLRLRPGPRRGSLQLYSKFNWNQSDAKMFSYSKYPQWMLISCLYIRRLIYKMCSKCRIRQVCVLWLVHSTGAPPNILAYMYAVSIMTSRIAFSFHPVTVEQFWS